MPLSNPLYIEICWLYQFSQILSGVIGKLSKSYQLKTINCTGMSQAAIAAYQNGDVVKLWDNHNQNLDYGRYLTFQKNETSIEFWLGLDTTQAGTRFIVWFDKTPLSLDAAIKTNPKLIPHAKNPESSPAPAGEYWIPMEDDDFIDFCNASTPSAPTPELEEFIEAVLKNL